MADTVSALPSVMQKKMQSLQASVGDPDNLGGGEPPAVTPPVEPPAASSEPPAPSQGGERVTLSRDEYNALQADAGRAQTVAGRESVLQMELEEARQRLTELEAQVKGSSKSPETRPPAQSPVTIVDTAVQFTDDETERYGESKEYIEKVATQVFASLFNKYLPNLNEQIENVRQQTEEVVTTFKKNTQQSFHEKVKGQVPDLQTLIKDKNWAAFLDGVEPITQATYNALLMHHVNNQSIDGVKAVYDAFRSKYVAPITTTGNAGYAGAGATGTASNLPPESKQQQKLKLSDRNKASEDYRKGRIKWDELQEIKKKFEEAEKAGNIDYNS